MFLWTDEVHYIFRSHFAHALLSWFLEHIHEPESRPRQVGILYDIGCNIEKGLAKVFQILSDFQKYFN